MKNTIRNDSARRCQTSKGSSLPQLLTLGACIAVFTVPACTLASTDSTPFSTSAVIKAQSNGGSDDFSTDNRKRIPWFVSLGVFIPNFSSPGISVNSGAEFAIGYRFATDYGDLRISSRGQAFSETASGVDSSGNPVSGSETVSIDVLSLEALYRTGALYFGPGIGIGSASAFVFVSGSGGSAAGTASESITLFSLALGYDFSKRFFGEARWQSASDSSLNGYSLSLGYRF